MNFDHSDGVKVYGEGVIDGKGVEWKKIPFGNSGRCLLYTSSTSVGDYWNKMELTLPSTSTVLQTARHSVYQKIQLKTPVTLLTRLPFLEKQPIGSVH